MRSGLGKSIGYALESTPGTPVTVTNFLPLVDDGLTQTIERMESAAVIKDRRVLASSQWADGRVVAGGDVSFELYNKGIEDLLTACFGAVTPSGSGPYTRTYTPGDLSGDSMTVQVIRPDSGNTDRPFTYPGSKVTSWELACTEGEIATFGVTLDSKWEIGHRTVTDGVTTNTSTAITSSTAAFTYDDVGKPISGTGIPAGATIAAVTSATAATLSAAATATGTGVTFTIGIAAAAVSYPSGLVPYHFLDGSVSIAGSSVKVKSATLSGDNGLDPERRFIGQRFRDEPYEAAHRTYDGSLELEFTDRTQYDRYVRGAEVALVLAFSSGADSLTFTANARFDGETPSISGTDIGVQNLPFKCVGSTDAAALTAVLINDVAT